jgi:hypothetical protein
VLIEGGDIGSEGGGLGRGASWDLELTIQPLPPAGPLAFICAWPGRGIATSRVEVDGAAIREAADTAVTLWPNDPYCAEG